MGLTNENIGPKILAKIKIYVLHRAELLFKVCYEIPCSTSFPNATLTSCPFFSLTFGWVCCCFAVALLLLCCCTHPKVSEKKWATGQSCIRKSSTTCKIGTLAKNSNSQIAFFPRQNTKSIFDAVLPKPSELFFAVFIWMEIHGCLTVR